MGGFSAATSIWRRTVVAALAAAMIAPPLAAQPVAPPAPRLHMDRLTLVVPAAVGGGWDITAKAMKSALEREGLVGQVSIVRYPGAGGLIGLSQFVAHDRGKDDILLIGGLVMLGAALRDEAAVTMRDVTPIARLTGDWDILAAPPTSSVHDVADIRATMARDPAKLRWVGGALGGPDQGLVYSVADRLGVSPDNIEYYARAGGRRVTQSLLEGRGDVGVSGYAEFGPYVASHALKVIAVAAPHRLAGVDAPTLRELGIDTTMMNWRAVFAAPGISAAQRDRLAGLVAAMAHSPSWHAQLGAEHWTDAYLDGMPLSQFIDREQTRWSDMINPPRRGGTFAVEQGGRWSARANMISGLAALVVLLGVAAWMALGLRHRRRMTRELEKRCDALSAQLDLAPASAGAAVKTVIDGDFQEWRLSEAENDIAWFMLRGLPLREIADVRGTSERTVRQQAQAIYRKAGLDGRSDLAGRVLERFI